MAWVSFLFGRPGSEYTFEVPPEGMSISPMALKSLQRNLIGDYRKSVLKTDVPSIKINSSFLSLTQRNQFVSLMGVADTFLSFICRNDWQVVNDLAGVIDVNHLQLSNNSALKLSQAYVQLGLASLITFITPFNTSSIPAFGLGAFGAGPFGIGIGGGTFDPGTITYNDLTMVLAMSNPLPSTNVGVFISYTYPGWLVELESIETKYQGGWVDRATWQATLTGA